MALFKRVRNFLGRDRLNREIDAEMAAHLAMRAEDNEAAGMSAGEARRDARVRFGGEAALREAVGEADSLPRVESLLGDLRYGWRQMVRYPGFSLVAVAVLAIGIGASAAIFAFVDAVLIKPMPYPEPQRLVGLFESTQLGSHYHLSYPDYVDWKRTSKSFAGIEAYDAGSPTLKSASGLELVPWAMVSTGFLRMVGVTPAAGRDFVQGEDGKNAAPVALISYAAWQRRFGGASGRSMQQVLGQTVVLEDKPYQIIGVLPKDFFFAGVGDAEFWVPLEGDPAGDRGQHSIFCLGRLRDGVSLSAARAEMSGIEENLARRYPDDDGGRDAVVEAWTEVVVGKVRPVLLLLAAGSVLLLCMAGVNVASLLLVRAEKRRREVAVRGALGASRGRLLRQFVVEGVLLAGMGTVAGMTAAVWAIRLLRVSIPAAILDSMPFLRTLGLNWAMVGFGVVVGIVCSAVFALIPLLRLGSTLTDVGGGLAAGGRASTGGFWRQMGSKLVVVQLMLAVVLLTGAGLLAQSLHRLIHADLGMDAGNLALVHLHLPGNAPEFQKKEGILAIEQQSLDVARQLPGVESVAISRHLPVNNSVAGNSGFAIAGRPQTKSDASNEATNRMVSANLLATLKTRLISGRFFTETDDAAHPMVAIVNESFVRRYFPGEEAVGKGILFETKGPVIRIVGVIENMREGALDGVITPAIYQPFEQAPEGDFFVVARVKSDPEQFAQVLEAKLRGLRADILTYSAMTMEDRIQGTQAAGMHRASAALVGGFAVLAMVLSAVGLYGVIAYSVSQRTREIGVRMALGASRGDVSGMVLREAARLAGVGLGLGLVCAVGAAMLMRSLLYGVAPWDGMTLLAVVGLLGACSVVAGWLPARRAASVDPMMALRAE